jgi:hypothetical protein
MSKNGRFFYGSDDGKVKELLFKDYSNSVLKIFKADNKSINKIDH